MLTTLERPTDVDTWETVMSENTSAARKTIARFTSYTDAESAVDYLSDKGFPVSRVAVIGHDLKLVEQVTGRLNYGGAAWRGALSGALTGALIGWIFGLFDWLQPLIASFTLAFFGLVFGAIVGAVFGLIVHALQGGRRDFASVRAMLPSVYELVVDTEVADEATRLLASRQGAHAATNVTMS